VANDGNAKLIALVVSARTGTFFLSDTEEFANAYRGGGNVKFGGPVKVSGTTI